MSENMNEEQTIFRPEIHGDYIFATIYEVLPYFLCRSDRLQSVPNPEALRASELAAAAGRMSCQNRCSRARGPSPETNFVNKPPRYHVEKSFLG